MFDLFPTPKRRKIPTKAPTQKRSRIATIHQYSRSYTAPQTQIGFAAGRAGPSRPVRRPSGGARLL